MSARPAMLMSDMLAMASKTTPDPIANALQSRPRNRPSGSGAPQSLGVLLSFTRLGRSPEGIRRYLEYC